MSLALPGRAGRHIRKLHGWWVRRDRASRGSHDADDAVFLAGAGRSGTTWLGDLINYRNAYRVMFEPFRPNMVPELEAVGWRRHQYLRPGASGPCAAMAERILEGRIQNEWVDQFDRNPCARRRLIKDIRANFILGWLRAQRPRVPVVFIMRHPIPTVMSQVKLGWKPPTPELFRRQPELMADFLDPYLDRITTARDAFGARILLWCLMNLVPLRQFASGGLHVVFYEDLCRRPAEVLPGVLAHVGEPYSDEILSALRVPSQTAQPGSAIRHGADPVESWRSEVTSEQMDAALEILAWSGLDRVYGAESAPRLAAAEVPRLFGA